MCYQLRSLKPIDAPDLKKGDEHAIVVRAAYESFASNRGNDSNSNDPIEQSL